MASSVSSCLIFFCLFLLAQHGASYHTSYTIGSRQFFVRSSSSVQPQASEAPASCSSIPSGLGSNKMPVVHRLSPCSRVHGTGASVTLTDISRRDHSRIRSLFAARSSGIMADGGAPAPAPAPAPASGGITIPTNSTSEPALPGVQDYDVLIGYGTPVQQLPVFLDTSLGISLLRCKPCLSGATNCDPAFDSSRSSTFTHVPCGSPECPSNCSGSVCPLPGSPMIHGLRGSVALDVLTLTPSTGIHDFRFGCVEVDGPADMPEAGTVDLSRDSHSLASRLSPPGAPVFSYCLPLSPSSPGFLSVGATVRAQRPGGAPMAHAPLVQNPEYATMYFIDLVGMSLAGKDLLIPPGTFTANGTALDVATAFTHLDPAAYAPLRDAFRKEMSGYPVAPGSGELGLDTCYNFTGLNEVTIPLIQLKFGNGESLILHMDQMLYYENPAVAPFTVTCLAFAALEADDPFNVIGTSAQTSTEVVYDVSAGTVGFIPRSC